MKTVQKCEHFIKEGTQRANAHIRDAPHEGNANYSHSEPPQAPA